MTVMYWLLAAAAFLILEMLTMGLTSIWFAGGALVGAVAARLYMPLGVQIAAFAVVSVEVPRQLWKQQISSFMEVCPEIQTMQSSLSLTEILHLTRT